ncbi:c-type cytochrome biogenesis protein CcmI [Aliiruegeria sabulilitoris]|uniref:c-type cytochrome biogenesis protein CcmI n=1 Tax=Aliiruegeria sabulilitoris TaxID=1510458 RepID=UPI000835EC1B|nr:c-type cytochrome biogenesis protein CcmI [Aliiruegeria sabulilitoris]NDR55294.1 c-type cytochrome biogenesis protein CcmI [Pseudoruegeria sp. M32A2M]
MTFWVISSVLTLVSALLIGWALLRPRAQESSDADKLDIRIYKDQLRAVEKDLARGVVTEEEAGRLRTEIKRRILDADRSDQSETQAAPRSASFAAAAIAGLFVIGGSFLIYDRLGAPGYEDQPLSKRVADAERMRAARPSQAEYEAKIPVGQIADIDPKYAELVEQLRKAVQERPEELQGWVLLARNEARLGNLPEAHAAQKQVIELKGKDATTQDYTAYASMLIQAAGGNVSKEADGALNGALSLDPNNPIARYYVGLMQLQTGRPDQAFAFWEPLLRQGPADAPWIPIIRARLEGVAALAGIHYTLPPTAPMAGLSGGPTAEDMAAAADMSPQERQEMIQSMVEQLGARMAEEGGPPSDWAKLIRAHGVLGNRNQAAAIWAEAQQTFSASEDLVPIREAAVSAGVADGAPEERGPSAEDVAAAAEMTSEDRREMIRGMVEQLGDRLATEGGPPQDWARMISSLGVLGERDWAAAIWGEAQERFEDPEHLAIVREAAIAIGLEE